MIDNYSAHLLSDTESTTLVEEVRLPKASDGAAHAEIAHRTLAGEYAVWTALGTALGDDNSATYRFTEVRTEVDADVWVFERE